MTELTKQTKPSLPLQHHKENIVDVARAYTSEETEIMDFNQALNGKLKGAIVNRDTARSLERKLNLN